MLSSTSTSSLSKQTSNPINHDHVHLSETSKEQAVTVCLSKDVERNKTEKDESKKRKNNGNHKVTDKIPTDVKNAKEKNNYERQNASLESEESKIIEKDHPLDAQRDKLPSCQLPETSFRKQISDAANSSIASIESKMQLNKRILLHTPTLRRSSQTIKYPLIASPCLLGVSEQGRVSIRTLTIPVVPVDPKTFVSMKPLMKTVDIRGNEGADKASVSVGEGSGDRTMNRSNAVTNTTIFNTSTTTSTMNLRNLPIISPSPRMHIRGQGSLENLLSADHLQRSFRQTISMTSFRDHPHVAETSSIRCILRKALDEDKDSLMLDTNIISNQKARNEPSVHQSEEETIDDVLKLWCEYLLSEDGFVENEKLACEFGYNDMATAMVLDKSNYVSQVLEEIFS